MGMRRFLLHKLLQANLRFRYFGGKGAKRCLRAPYVRLKLCLPCLSTVKESSGGGNLAGNSFIDRSCFFKAATFSRVALHKASAGSSADKAASRAAICFFTVASSGIALAPLADEPVAL